MKKTIGSIRRVSIFQDKASKLWKEELIVVRGKTEVVQTVLAHLPRGEYENRECSVCGDIWMEVSLWSVILETLCAPIHTFKITFCVCSCAKERRKWPIQWACWLRIKDGLRMMFRFTKQDKKTFWELTMPASYKIRCVHQQKSDLLYSSPVAVAL